MSPSTDAPTPEPFDIDEVFRRLRIAVADLPPAAMFDLKRRGFSSPFEQLVGALISVRTRDETTLDACLRLFAEARTPDELLGLDPRRLVELLHGVGFREVKARDLLEIARQVRDDHNGQVPDSLDGLLAFRGVGPKIAALTIASAFERPAICVDIHVHRITNRWGHVHTKTPEKTAEALAAVLPERYWIEINERLVPFGKFICTAGRPKCSACSLRSMCRRVGVEASR